MLTRMRIRNFKRFEDSDIELGKAVVLIGPNNSGKTTALQALALWDIGLRRWNEKRKGKPSPEKRPGVTVNRRDLVSIPVPVANLLWHNMHVRNVRRSEENGSQTTENVRVDIVVEGDGITIAFNARYLTEVLGAMTCQKIGLETNTPTNPGVLRPIDDDGYIHVIMPLQLPK